ncbi:hypothetical protein ONZ45_g8474 [Pleurotus djamor]|nr:hypothetical protein ONZ45_g8474 [Pleurotus djamor]
MPICGCGQVFAHSGIRQHQRASIDPICQSQAVPDIYPSEISQQEPLPHEQPQDTYNEASRFLDINFDPQGDYFGDYDDLNDPDEAVDLADQESSTQNGDDNEDLDGQATMDEEMGLEAERTERPALGDTIIEDNGNLEEVTPMRLRGGAEVDLQKKPFIVRYPGEKAGKVYKEGGGDMNTKYNVSSGGNENPYHPFKSKIDWEVAHWAKTRGPSSTAFTELMQIEGVAEKLGVSFKNANELNTIIDESLPGRPRFERHEILVGGEVCEVFSRNIIECIRALYGDPDFAQYLAFVPEKHYTDETESERLFHDMQTGRWWWATQEELEKTNPGATIVPIILSSDKTQLTLFRNKSAYPLYLTIGNIPKEIRRKPSKRAYILLAYLPITKLEGVTNKASRRRQLANLYHACLSHILAPLHSAGLSGLFLTSGDGLIRRGHPIFACFIGDYPEQTLVTATKSGCPTCPAKPDELGHYTRDDPSPWLKNLNAILDVLDSFDVDPGGFLQACQEVGIKPIIDPFWKDLPYCHIYRSITPDILHQLLQGVIKHVISWVTDALGAAEIDARCRRMPPNHNVRLFLKGITSLSRVTGQEHDQMCRILLGLIVDIPLPNGFSNVRLIRAVRAVLDFLYLAQYPVHSDRTLKLLEDALEAFHTNKGIFVDLGIRDSFNIPKLHFAKHYVHFIQLYGTLDNFNTEYTERLHIDLAKDAYEATNHKDEFRQMTVWLERKEKILRHHQHVQWRLKGSPAPEKDQWISPGLTLDRSLSMTKHPSVRGVLMTQLAAEYGATYFREALVRYIILQNRPDITRAELERNIWNVRLPFTKIPVWHRIKYQYFNPSMKSPMTSDAIHCHPQRLDVRGNVVPARFDTALINDGTAGLNNSYVITGGVSQDQLLFLKYPYYDPDTLTNLQATKGTATVGELLTQNMVQPASNYTNATYIGNGVNDLPFCGGNCSALSWSEDFRPAVPNTKNLTVEYYNNSAHGIELQYVASQVHDRILGWLGTWVSQ